MRLFVPFNVEEISNSLTVTVPFDPQFRVQARNPRQAAKVVWRNAGRLIQKHKPLELLEKLPSYYDKKGFNYVVVDLFSPAENILMCLPFFMASFLFYCISWFFIINLGMLHTGASQMMFDTDTMIQFQKYQVHFGLFQTLLYIVLWGWFYSSIYPYLRNFYAMSILNNSTLLDLHQSTLGRFASFLRKKSLLSLETIEVEITEEEDTNE